MRICFFYWFQYRHVLIAMVLCFGLTLASTGGMLAQPSQNAQSFRPKQAFQLQAFEQNTTTDDGEGLIDASLAPPSRQNIYEQFNNRGIWDYNLTPAKSGLFWQLPDSGQSEGRSGNKPETAKYLQPSFQELNVRFYQVEAAELRRVISPKEDPTYAVLMNTQPMLDATGRKLPPGMYAVALRQLEDNTPQPVETLEQLQTTESQLALQGQVSETDTKPVQPLPGDHHLVYPRNDLTWQTQAHPYFIQNPRAVQGAKSVKIVSGRPGGSPQVAGQGSLVLIVKQQGVLKGIFPVVGQQGYSPTRKQRKAKPAFAQVGTHPPAEMPYIALYVGNMVYLASAQQDLPPVVYPQTRQTSGNRYDY